MNEQNTLKLLRECDVGIKMGITAIDDVISRIKNTEFHDKMAEYKREYFSLQNEIRELLNSHNDDGKSPDLIAKSMAWMKTMFKICFNENDRNIADVLTDGCNMGIKTLSKFLNRFHDADDEAISLANKLVDLGERQVNEMKQYL